MALWWDHELARDFCKIDFAILRRRLHTVSISPPEYVDNYLERQCVQAEVVDGGVISWVCGVQADEMEQGGTYREEVSVWGYVY
eukprot:6878669-Pyramimonas_sp.AAC.1